MDSVSEIKPTTPLGILQKISRDENMPISVRLDAAKALLPYTAKKTSETLETVNRNFTIRDERLGVLTNEQLSTLLDLVRQLSTPGTDASASDTDPFPGSFGSRTGEEEI